MLKRRAGKSEAPRIYAYEYYQRIYEFEERHWWSIGMRTITGRLLDRHLQDRQHRRILDVGCGTGSMLSWLERYADPQRIVGIDLSRHALGFCQERRLRRLAQASITQLPFPDECFDLVTCADVLQHLPRDGSDRQAIVECRRVLRPGGLV
jgi:ubiquinone/menaquinone biosynthesis C-methylase UbiE